MEEIQLLKQRSSTDNNGTINLSAVISLVATSLTSMIEGAINGRVNGLVDKNELHDLIDGFIECTRSNVDKLYKDGKGIFNIIAPINVSVNGTLYKDNLPAGSFMYDSINDEWLFGTRKGILKLTDNGKLN